MPSEFNHIDDFFRRKEDEASADYSMQDKHWQQMKGLLASPPTARVRTLNPKTLWQFLFGFSFVAVIVLLVWRNIGGNDNHAQADNSINSGVVKNKKISSKTTGEKNTIAANADAQKIKTPFVLNGDFKINFPIADQYDYLKQPSHEIRTEQNIFSSISIDDQTVSSQAQLASFFDQLKNPGQEFTINTDRDTTIYCKEGTSITIPANSFQNDKGIVVNGELKFTVREFYEMADIIGNKLTTTSDTKQLVTGGMVHLQAMVDRNPVSPKKEASLTVKMPTNRFDPDMQLFYGKQENPGTNSEQHGNLLKQEEINWNPAGQKQFYFDLNNWTITVTDWANDPRDVVTRRGKKIAKFIVPDYFSPEALEHARKQLILRHGWKYDEIKIRRGWKRERDTKNTPMANTIPTIDGMVGEQLRLTLKVARSLELISASDSVWQVERAKKIIEKSDSLQRQYLQLQNQYTFNINAVGWINCDKFLASMGPRTQFTASTGDQFENTYFRSFLIFKDMNSILGGTWMNGKLVFDRVPVGKRVTLVCVGIKDGKAIYSIKETVISSTPLTGLEFEETNPSDFKEQLKRFGNVQRG